MTLTQNGMDAVDDAAEEVEKSVQARLQKQELRISPVKLDAAIERMKDAVKSIAADVDKLYSAQPKVYVPDFSSDLTALRTAYDDLVVAAGHRELLETAP